MFPHFLSSFSERPRSHPGNQPTYGIRKPQNLRPWARHFTLVAIFIWIGLGIGGHFNPWVLFQKIPVLDFAHIQSRVLIFSHFLFTIFVAWVLDQLRQRKGLYLAIACFLLVKSWVVKTYPFLPALMARNQLASVDLTVSHYLLSTQSVVYNSNRPTHYVRGSQGSQSAKEPFLPPTTVAAVGDANYRGHGETF